MFNEGELFVDAYTDDGLNTRATLQVADVTRPLMAVSDIKRKANTMFLFALSLLVLCIQLVSKNLFQLFQ